MRIVCRLFGHAWFGRRASRRVEWIGDNTGRLRQVTTCGRCPEAPHSGVLNPRRRLDVESWSSLLGRIPPCTWGFHRLNPAEIGRISVLVTASPPGVHSVHRGIYSLVV